MKDGAPFSLNEGGWGWKNPQRGKRTRRINWRLVAWLGVVDVSLAAAFAIYHSGGSGTTAGSYVNCASIGKVTSASDPRGDVFSYGVGAPPADQPQLDLTKVTVARGGDKLCVDFITTARPQAGATLGIWLAVKTPDGAEPSGGFAGEDIRLEFPPDGRRYVTVRPTAYPDLDDGVRRAEIGQAGSRTSIVIARDQLPSSTPFDDFMWHAETISAQSQPEQYHDIAPRGETMAAAVRYPEGALWVEPPPQAPQPAQPPAAVQPPAPQPAPPDTALPQPDQIQPRVLPTIPAPYLYSSAEVEQVLDAELVRRHFRGWFTTCPPGGLSRDGDVITCDVSPPTQDFAAEVPVTLLRGKLRIPY
jgi:hypothetical protein